MQHGPETAFGRMASLRPAAQLGAIDRASPYLWTPAPTPENTRSKHKMNLRTAGFASSGAEEQRCELDSTRSTKWRELCTVLSPGQ
jgi:hypothetical protein